MKSAAESFAAVSEYHGCITGDCPHQDQRECFEAIFTSGYRYTEIETAQLKDALGISEYALRGISMYAPLTEVVWRARQEAISQIDKLRKKGIKLNE